MFASEDVVDRIRNGISDQIEAAVRKRFGDSVQGVSTEVTETAFGEIKLVITIEIAQKVEQKEWRKKFFGLTSIVQDAMGSEYRNVFPEIQPVSALAHA